MQIYGMSKKRDECNMKDQNGDHDVASTVTQSILLCF